jgi:succinoglycan biosynthesis protein ExoO
MLQQPLVSILTPAYKAEPYIGQAIESVLAQTMPDWELIIVEDCSPDNTAQVVERYLDDPRITLIHNEQNLGANGSRNRALEVAQGKWIALLDADDWYEPQRLERLVQFAEANHCKAVIDLRRCFYEGTGQTKIARISSVYPNPKVPKEYSVYECVNGHIVEKPLMLHEIIRTHNLRYTQGILRGGDFLFQIQYLYRAGSLWVIPEVLYNYRIHPQSITQRLRTEVSHMHILYQTFLNLPEVQQDPRLRKAALTDYRRSLGYQRLNDFRQAVRRWNLIEAAKICRETPIVLQLYLKGIPEAIIRRIHMGTKES